MRDQELAKNVRYDSVFLGFRLGDTRNAFMDKCMSLNKQQLVTQGPRGGVLYYLRDSLHQQLDDIKVLIFARFDEQEIVNRIDLEFSYNAWAPWNKQYQSEVLLKNLTKLMMDWYGGNEFIHVTIEGKELPVKIDGNRRLLLRLEDAQTVIMRVSDLKNPSSN